MITSHVGMNFMLGSASLGELRSMFPSGGDLNLLVLPYGADPADGWPLPSTRMWSPPVSWDDLAFLFDAMSSRGRWKEYETGRKRDELRDFCMVHHFHLGARRKMSQRSNYRWFAFRDPERLGNVWFNLGGTYASLGSLGSLWTSAMWMERIKELYPWVAAKYRIRGVEGMPQSGNSNAVVRAVWKKELGCYPVVRVGDDVFLCAGERAQTLDLDRSADPDRWSVFMTPDGMFAMMMGADGETILGQMADARDIADRLEVV